VTAPARLLALRLQGFKSFGERTLVEFGPGISAVVGPNGSGKSNLADALRWALGEQGRALRLRKSEDVIFAGSEKRSALGMADVTLVFGNSDRLLPIDFETVELGRRLFRSGENDYLLNKQRVRLRDLIDLLDAAHLADNAFLFIGQGMVDQALALRPEERRPLFEEVAGVRRHERRKNKAEEQLVEAEANLARVEDVVAELRPQARRLAAQAEQQASRKSAGREYGSAIIAVARSRWQDAARRAHIYDEQLRTGRAEVEAAFNVLRGAEERASGIARELATGSEREAERRAVHESARASLIELQLRDVRVAGDAAAVERDRTRLEAELAAAMENLEVQRRELAVSVPSRDLSLAAALSEAERSLGEALEELGAMRAAGQARGDALAALRRVVATRAAELDTVRRRLADAERQAADQRAQADEGARRLAEAEAGCAGPRAALERATAAEKASLLAREQARAELDAREGGRQASAEKAAGASSRAAGLRGRLDGLRERLAEEETRGIARAARRAGGRPLAEGLEVESGFRVAVEAALGDAIRGYIVGRDAIPALDGQRGTLVVGSGAGLAGLPSGARAVDGMGGSLGRESAGPEGGRAAAEAAQAVVAAAAGYGGGKLSEAIRVDPGGAASRLLSRAVWLPDLTAALAMQPQLAPGWVAVTRDGAVVTAAGVVSLGRSESLLDRRAEIDRLAEEVTGLEREAEAASAEAASAAQDALVARATLEAAREVERMAGATRRAAEEVERRAARALEGVAREAAWHMSQATRLEADRDRLIAAAREAAESAEAATAGQTATGVGAATPGSATAAATLGAATPDTEGQDHASALREWEARAASLRARRDQLAAEDSTLELVRREVETRRARAGAAAEMQQARIAQLERDTVELSERERELTNEREGLGEELAAAAIREAAVRAELQRIQTAEVAARGRLADAESTASNARGRLRACQDRVRAAEVSEMQARLALEAIREQALVELAGLGDLGLRLLADESNGDEGSVSADSAVSVAVSGGDGGREGEGDLEGGATLEDLLAEAGERWVSAADVEPPGAARLAALRRRFHELGAPNPFASEEYATVKVRLDGLEAQKRDLIAAIAKTRALIEQLNSMISTQFRTTFKALETAFDARFRQLFDGGFARLSLTEPDDLAATGIEIVARPPGKKAQSLSMLSGGERALTAVALLFSMLEVHPVPFCVLDEVDAALDEANVDRFAEALRSLAADTQFIVITHNRGTIETADALYGVTVGDDAVSHVISLRLEEARELVDEVTHKNAATAD
jgi:chromosome segregation protein